MYKIVSFAMDLDSHLSTDYQTFVANLKGFVDTLPDSFSQGKNLKPELVSKIKDFAKFVETA